MPTSTFFRLPEEKRGRLTRAAWEEFTQVSYAQASINKIIRRAHIPRGSFYQYFADKEDLFRHLLRETQDHFAVLLAQLMEEAGGDLFRFPLLAFDRFSAAGESADQPVLRAVRLLRCNVGMDLQGFMVKQARLRPDFLPERMDRSRFRREGEEFAEQVFTLLMLCTAGAVVETLTHPEQRSEQRALLCARVDILARGSLRPESPSP